MNMKDMKEELKKWGCTTSGKKEDLVNRLVAAIESSVPVTVSVVARHESMTGLDVTAKWELLTPEDLPVEEPKIVTNQLNHPLNAMHPPSKIWL